MIAQDYYTCSYFDPVKHYSGRNRFSMVKEHESMFKATDSSPKGFLDR
jgi:hypothetical protein